MRLHKTTINYIIFIMNSKFIFKISFDLLLLLAKIFLNKINNYVMINKLNNIDVKFFFKII